MEVFAVKQFNHETKDQKLSYDYIRGLVDGEGCFSFHTGSRRANGRKYKIPTFVIAMNERDRNLIEKVKNTLGLKNKIYSHAPWLGDGYRRGPRAVLYVRDIEQLKNIIIPLFYKKLHGYKGRQFIEWLEKIGSDPDVSVGFKTLYRLYKIGIYDSDSAIVQKFSD
jgi:hypothetical protein